jgi:hypothetical protein
MEKQSSQKPPPKNRQNVVTDPDPGATLPSDILACGTLDTIIAEVTVEIRQNDNKPLPTPTGERVAHIDNSTSPWTWTVKITSLPDSPPGKPYRLIARWYEPGIPLILNEMHTVFFNVKAGTIYNSKCQPPPS